MRIALVRIAAAVAATLATGAAPAWAAPAAAAQDGVQVTAGLSSGVIKLGERTSIVVSVERQGTQRGDAAAQPFGALPTVDGLAIGAPSGPSTSSFQSVVGRRVTTTSSQRWVIPVRPERAGEFEIPPFELTVDGKRYATSALHLKVVEDMRGAELGFLEVTPSSTKVVEGQPFTLAVELGWDAALNGVNFGELSLGFWDGIPGAIEVESDFPPPGADVMERWFTVNGTSYVDVEVLPQAEVRGRTFHRFRILRSFLPTRGGRIEIPESFLNFGRAQERGSFFDRRVVKVEDYYVGAPERYVDVLALPEEGRPLDYTGAVGDLEVRASVDRRDVDQGESIKLTVEWTGAGNLEFFDAPELGRMESFAGFRVYGRTEDKDFDRRTAVYDLAPLAPDVDAIPPVPLWVFDPESSEYVELATQPIPIRVRALAGAVALEDEEEERELARDLRDIDARPPARGGDPGAGPPAAAALAALLGAPLLGLLVRVAVRRRGDPSAPAARRRRAARRRLARALKAARGPEDELRALYAFLAARSGELPEAWVGRDVGAPDPDGRGGGGAATELARTIERLETAVWSGRNGSAAAVPPGEVLALADRLMKEGL
jgi:hypothetical protein